MRKNINSTHKLPRNPLHEIVWAAWAEILFLELLIDIPQYWFFSLVDHKQLPAGNVCSSRMKGRRQAGREGGRGAKTVETHHMYSTFMLLLFRLWKKQLISYSRCFSTYELW